jgi:hypothetical protein
MTRAPTSPDALAILHQLADGEWHPVIYLRRVYLDRLEDAGFIHVAADEAGALIAIATDTGLAVIAERRCAA